MTLRHFQFDKKFIQFFHVKERSVVRRVSASSSCLTGGRSRILRNVFEASFSSRFPKYSINLIDHLNSSFKTFRKSSVSTSNVKSIALTTRLASRLMIKPPMKDARAPARGVVIYAATSKIADVITTIFVDDKVYLIYK